MSATGNRVFHFPSREFKASRWNVLGSGILFAILGIATLMALTLTRHSKGFELEMGGLVLASIAAFLGIGLIVWGLTRQLRTLTISDTSVCLWRGNQKWKELHFDDIQETYVVGRPTVFKSANDYGMRDTRGNTLFVRGIGTYKPLNLVKAMLAERLPDGVAPTPWMEALNDLT